jgi:SAM-dependent methyltransferase
MLKKITTQIKKSVYSLNGKHPWSLGYFATRNQFIESVLSNLENQFIPEPTYGFGFDERVVEYPWLVSKLSDKPSRLLDAGSILNFDFILQQKKIKNKRICITTLAPERHCYWKDGISYTFDDLRDLPFKNHTFDEIVCISTLEHIGLDNKIYFQTEIGEVENTTELVKTDKVDSHLVAVSEMHRVLKPGGKLYLTVPFGKSQKLGWLQVFNSQGIDQVISTFSPSNVDETVFIHNETGWAKSTRAKASTANYYNVHSGEKTDHLAAAEAVIALVLTKHESNQ